MLRPTLTRAILAAVALLTLIPATHAAELRSADIHPDDYPTVQAVRQFGELVKQRTNGRITVKVYAGGALGNEDDSIEQVKLGALAMARVSSAAMHNICQTTRVPSLPFLFRSKEHLHKVLDSEIGERILKSCESAGFVGLAWYDSGSRSMYTRNKPIKTLADAKGMKIRVQQSDLSVAMVEAMGGNATPMPMGEVYTSLKTGLVDAAENNYPSYESAHHYEVAKYYALTEHTMTPEILIFSKRQWDKLSAEDQKVLREAARESVPYMRKLWDEREQKSRAVVEKAGSQIVEVDKASFQAAMKPVYDRFVTTPDMKDLVAKIQAVQ
ncbi:TRAP transporter substrate-binding protein [Achromobacter xylosoxidans]|uniref:TRAP transporter substrate-binding protein n=1 Tax=Alcaligenes xylosoxydans xylosoxydans TaxID=85698 RepID=UPI0006682FDD|nr:TRAP transporter substrate-binding protein [Achromobacter xylosoxidans]AMH07381.1 C4-dicarboxylate ABC transporter [Achromobacter xylosoxidans]KWU17597.1 C4-dicarboxylate ABC transporter [Achromobacter xylosoxidans]PWV43070.1 TRAP transporter substrate-binding protein [Achromobacter xylosoxidans]CUI58599.1 Extracytoplasmic solute receptor protein yiaO [Achromobacter xylosoxidans]